MKVSNCYTVFIVILTVVGTTPALGQSKLKSSEFTPASFEISANLLQVPIYRGDATVGKINSQGIMIEAGYRPAIANQRLLLETFFMFVPKQTDSNQHAPQVSSLGIASSYLLLDPSYRINPFLGVGYGLYGIDDGPEAACILLECMAEGGPSYQAETLQVATLNTGLYFSVTKSIAFRADVRLLHPVGSDFENSSNNERRLTYSIGTSFRF